MGKELIVLAHIGVSDALIEFDHYNWHKKDKQKGKKILEMKKNKEIATIE